MNKTVSIIMPLYNCERFIEDTIRSVLEQKYPYWELIIVDDCSSDNSKEIVLRYAEKDERIRLICLKENRGVANARNIGIEQATGRFLAFLDSDDLWKAEKLLIQVGFMEENNCPFSYSAYELIDDSGGRLNKIIHVPESVDYKTLLMGNCIGCLTVVIDRQLIPNVRMPSLSHEDYATWLTILKNGVTAMGVNEILAYYRKSNSSLSANKLKTLKWTWNVYRKSQRIGIFRSTGFLFLFIVNTILKYLR